MGVREVERRLRERQLASDARAGEDIRGRVREDLLSLLRLGWRRYAVVALIGITLVGGLAALIPDARMQGVLLGGGLTWWFSALLFVLVQASGAAPRLMGADGETWTATEIRRMKRHEWRLVNDVYLADGNIDHVLVGPGGVIAVESKWSAHSWAARSSDAGVRSAAVQVHSQARRLRLWHELKSRGVTEVRPLVVLWGAGTSGDRARAEHTLVEGVDVVTGHHLRQWLRAQSGSLLAQEAVDETWSVLAEQCRRRDTYLAGERPRPRSMQDGVRDAVALFTAFMLGFVGGCQIAADVNDGRRWAVAAAIAAVASAVAWRVPRSRRFLTWVAAGLVTAGFLIISLIGLLMV